MSRESAKRATEWASRPAVASIKNIAALMASTAFKTEDWRFFSSSNSQAFSSQHPPIERPLSLNYAPDDRYYVFLEGVHVMACCMGRCRYVAGDNERRRLFYPVNPRQFQRGRYIL